MQTDIITYGSVAFGAVYLLGRALVNFFDKEEKYDFYLYYDKDKIDDQPGKEHGLRRWPIRDGDTVIFAWGSELSICEAKDFGSKTYPLSLKNGAKYYNSTFTRCGMSHENFRVPSAMVVYEEDQIKQMDFLDASLFILSEAKKCNWVYKHKGRY